MNISTARRRPPAAPPTNGTASTDLCLRIPTDACTLAGFRAWVKSDEFPAHARATFVGREIILDMSKEELETHAKVKAEVSFVLMLLHRQRKEGYFYLDGVLITNESAGVSNNPDGTFVRRESIQLGRVRLVPRAGEQGQFLEIEGTPDWVLEVVSDGSLAKDAELLRRAYHRAGIPEYWLIDARGQRIEFHILHWRKKGYVAAPNRDGWQRSSVFGREFRLTRQRDDLGLWEYTLELRPV